MKALTCALTDHCRYCSEKSGVKASPAVEFCTATRPSPSSRRSSTRHVATGFGSVSAATANRAGRQDHVGLAFKCDVGVAGEVGFERRQRSERRIVAIDLIGSDGRRHFFVSRLATGRGSQAQAQRQRGTRTVDKGSSTTGTRVFSCAAPNGRGSADGNRGSPERRRSEGANILQGLTFSTLFRSNARRT